MTISDIDELIDETKDLSEDDMTKIAYSLNSIECGLYCLRMQMKYKKEVHI